MRLLQLPHSLATLAPCGKFCNLMVSHVLTFYYTTHMLKRCVGSSINSDWFVNGFIVFVCEIFFYFCQNFVFKGRLKIFLTDNHCKIIYEPVRID